MSTTFNPDKWLKWKPAQARSEESAKAAETGSEGIEGTVSVRFEKSETTTTPEKIAFNLDRWLKWKSSDTRSDEPAKPTDSGSEGFEGTVSVLPEKSESAAEKIAWARFQWAEATLFNNDVRILELDGVMTAGIWADLDSKDIRDALEIRFPGIPTCYRDGKDSALDKDRRVAGEPVPLSVLAEMVKCESRPWVKRDELLATMNWNPQGTLWTDKNIKITRTAPTKPSKAGEIDGFVGSVGRVPSRSRRKKKSGVTVFQESFFEELGTLLMSSGEVGLQERAERLGKPREAVEAFLRDKSEAD
ncbi:MAG: hypothetical protein ACJ746_12640 [Bryobacteraceae bacterium]